MPTVNWLTIGVCVLLLAGAATNWNGRRSRAFWQLRKTRGAGRRGGIISSFVFGAAAFVLLWSIAACINPDGPARIPPPLVTVGHLASLLIDGTIARELSRSLVRIFVGFGLAAVLGSAIGWLAGTYRFFHGAFLPLSSFCRYIPPMALVTLLVVYFGIGERYKIAVIFVGVFFFIIQMTIDAVDRLDIQYFEMAIVSGLPRQRFLLDLVVPGTLPNVLDVWRVNLSGAWTFLVAAEIVGADGGLGHLIAISRRFGHIEDLYAAILMFGIIGLLSDYAFQLSAKLAFPWRR